MLTNILLIILYTMWALTTIYGSLAIKYTIEFNNECKVSPLPLETMARLDVKKHTYLLLALTTLSIAAGSYFLILTQ